MRMHADVRRARAHCHRTLWRCGLAVCLRALTPARDRSEIAARSQRDRSEIAPLRMAILYACLQACPMCGATPIASRAMHVCVCVRVCVCMRVPTNEGSRVSLQRQSCARMMARG